MVSLSNHEGRAQRCGPWFDKLTMRRCLWAMRAVRTEPRRTLGDAPDVVRGLGFALAPHHEDTCCSRLLRSTTGSSPPSRGPVTSSPACGGGGPCVCMVEGAVSTLAHAPFRRLRRHLPPPCGRRGRRRADATLRRARRKVIPLHPHRLILPPSDRARTACANERGAVGQPGEGVSLRPSGRRGPEASRGTLVLRAGKGTPSRSPGARDASASCFIIGRCRIPGSSCHRQLHPGRAGGFLMPGRRNPLPFAPPAG